MSRIVDVMYATSVIAQAMWILGAVRVLLMDAREWRRQSAEDAFYAAQRDADARRYADDGALR